MAAEYNVYTYVPFTTTTCDDCGALTSKDTASTWSDVLVICDLHGKGRIAALQQEIDAMVEELRGLNDPMAQCYVCLGTGYIEYYKHYADGVCFTCNGTGEIRNGELPEDMGMCHGCNHGIAAGLLWPDHFGGQVCPECYEHITGRTRFYSVHAVCGKHTDLPETKCLACRDIAGKQGEDW